MPTARLTEERMIACALRLRAIAKACLKIEIVNPKIQLSVILK
ncbi:hypothetical protein [Brasilonema sennae]|nr:hypothetical protein [Brasilonema sennae]